MKTNSTMTSTMPSSKRSLTTRPRMDCSCQMADWIRVLMRKWWGRCMMILGCAPTLIVSSHGFHILPTREPLSTTMRIIQGSRQRLSSSDRRSKSNSSLPICTETAMCCLLHRTRQLIRKLRPKWKILPLKLLIHSFQSLKSLWVALSNSAVLIQSIARIYSGKDVLGCRVMITLS